MTQPHVPFLLGFDDFVCNAAVCLDCPDWFLIPNLFAFHARLTCEFQIEISVIQVPRQVLYAHCQPIKSSKRGSTKNITSLRSGLRGLDLCCRKIRLTSPIVVRARCLCMFVIFFVFHSFLFVKSNCSWWLKTVSTRKPEF